MPFFLLSSPRDRVALNTCDPLAGTWLLDWLDPVGEKDASASPRWGRILAFVLFLSLPLVVFSAIPSPLFGGNLVGAGSLTADPGVLSVLSFLLLTAFVLPIGRRLPGGLMRQLHQQGVVDDGIYAFSPAAASGRLLKLFEWISRVDGRRGAIWFFLLAGWQAICYFSVIMTNPIPTWQTSPADPESWMYVLSAGNRQPNLAGIWVFFSWNVFIQYLALVVARLIVVFACLCSWIASNQSLKITPYHPDGIGGLGPIGQAALFHSFFTFSAGVALAGITFFELTINRASRTSGLPMTSNMKVIVVLWILYFVTGTVLFFLPLLPLRQRMAEAKRDYLLRLQGLFSIASARHEEEVAQGRFSSETLQGLTALGSLYDLASNIPVWPFDTKTLLRYGGLLLSPLAPIVGNQLPALLESAKAYLGL